MTEVLLPPPSTTMVIRDIPLVDIYLDQKFNSRDRITKSQVFDLAKIIKAEGLMQAIVVQPYDKVAGKLWRVVAGHRRYVAFQVNKEETIPANIVYHLKDDMEARTFNLVENIKREDLNIKEEANALTEYLKYGWKNRQICEELQVTQSWLSPRLALLRLPEEAQDEAALGNLTMNQIVGLAKIEDKDRIFELIRQIKTARERGDAIEISPTRKKVKAFESRKRGTNEIFELQDVIRNSFGNSLVTRVLGWAAGVVSTYELYGDLKILSENEGVDFEIPKEIMDSINGVD